MPTCTTALSEYIMLIVLLTHCCCVSQAESYLKQRKYKAAENMYKQILQLASKQQDQAAPAPPTPGNSSV